MQAQAPLIQNPPATNPSAPVYARNQLAPNRPPLPKTPTWLEWSHRIGGVARTRMLFDTLLDFLHTNREIITVFAVFNILVDKFDFSNLSRPLLTAILSGQTVSTSNLYEIAPAAKYVTQARLELTDKIISSQAYLFGGLLVLSTLSLVRKSQRRFMQLLQHYQIFSAEILNQHFFGWRNHCSIFTKLLAGLTLLGANVLILSPNHRFISFGLAVAAGMFNFASYWLEYQSWKITAQQEHAFRMRDGGHVYSPSDAGKFPVAHQTALNKRNLLLLAITGLSAVGPLAYVAYRATQTASQGLVDTNPHKLPIAASALMTAAFISVFGFIYQNKSSDIINTMTQYTLGPGNEVGYSALLGFRVRIDLMNAIRQLLAMTVLSAAGIAIGLGTSITFVPTIGIMLVANWLLYGLACWYQFDMRVNALQFTDSAVAARGVPYTFKYAEGGIYQPGIVARGLHSCMLWGSQKAGSLYDYTPTPVPSAPPQPSI